MRFTVEFTVRMVDHGEVEVVHWGSTPFDADFGLEDLPPAACLAPLANLIGRMDQRHALGDFGETD